MEPDLVPMIASAAEFVRLRTSQVPEEYGRAAQDTATEAVWNEVIDRHPEMRPWVAHNKTIPEAIVRRLMEVGDHETRLMLAYKKKTPPDLLERLARDPSESVRLAVARHPKLPEAAREALAGDPFEEVRKVIAGRK